MVKQCVLVSFCVLICLTLVIACKPPPVDTVYPVIDYRNESAFREPRSYPGSRIQDIVNDIIVWQFRSTEFVRDDGKLRLFPDTGRAKWVTYCSKVSSKSHKYECITSGYHIDYWPYVVDRCTYLFLKIRFNKIKVYELDQPGAIMIKADPNIDSWYDFNIGYLPYKRKVVYEFILKGYRSIFAELKYDVNNNRLIK